MSCRNRNGGDCDEGRGCSCEFNCGCNWGNNNRCGCDRDCGNNNRCGCDRENNNRSDRDCGNNNRCGCDRDCRNNNRCRCDRDWDCDQEDNDDECGSRNCRREIDRFKKGTSELVSSYKSSEGKLYNEAHKHTLGAINALDGVDKLSKKAICAYEDLYSELEDSGCADEWNSQTCACRRYIRDARSFFKKSADERHEAKKALKSALNNIDGAKAYNCNAFAALSDFRKCINEDDEDEEQGHRRGRDNDNECDNDSDNDSDQDSGCRCRG